MGIILPTKFLKNFSKKYLTMKKGCGNIDELRQEEGASSKEFKKSSKKGLTKASGCDNIDKLLAWSEKAETRKDGQPKKPGFPKNPKVFWEKEQPLKRAMVTCVTEQKGELRRDV